MTADQVTQISSFYVAGINYRKSDASIRGQFSINPKQYESLIESAPAVAVNNLFVLSTCNRTEIYGFAENALTLGQLLCKHTEGSFEDFQKMCYCKKGVEAIEHLFNVAAGLDSQILGDYEIIGQLKAAVKFSKQYQVFDAYLERMINEVLAASKNIRTKTQLSSGTVSVSYAAVQCIRQNFPVITGKNILLVGAGKIGGNTCRNIKDYLPGANLTILNRSQEKAIQMAALHQINWGTMADFEKELAAADVVIVATNASEPVLLSRHLPNKKPQLLIDLSVPFNIDVAVKNSEGITLINVDELSRINDETLLKRAKEIPAVKLIIREHIAYFMEWHQMRSHVPVLKKIKSHILRIQHPDANSSFCIKPLGDEKIQKLINGMAVKLRAQNDRGCQYLEAMNDYIATASN